MFNRTSRPHDDDDDDGGGDDDGDDGGGDVDGTEFCIFKISINYIIM